MKLGDPVLKILNKIYPPGEMVEAKFKKHDLQFKTDENGYPVLLFIGEKNKKGTIKGERYVRTLKTLSNGDVKDHWEHKGKAGG
jgi:hypothetical protein